MKLDDAAYQRLRDMKRKQGYRRDYIKITVVLMLHRGHGPGGSLRAWA